jgi:acyl-CoA thioesterase I
MNSPWQKWLLIIIAFALVTWIAYAVFDKTTVRNIDSPNTTIVAFGDSLVHGVGATPGNDFISLLSARIGQPIINLGISGDTTRKGLARVQEVTAFKPRIVILLLGGNDYLQKIPKEETFSNLSAIIKEIHASGSAVLLLGVRGGLLRDTYGSDFKDFAKAHEVAFVPNVLDGLIGNQELMSDTIHPNDAGYIKIADKVEPILQKLLQP